jgi:ATP-dependent Clp protease ATP-binding subunit ClpA
MDIEKINLTASASKSISELESFAKQKGHNIINPIHLFYLCLYNSNHSFYKFIDSRGISLSLPKLEKIIDKFAQTNPSLFIGKKADIRVSPKIEDVLTACRDICKKYDHAYIGTDHIIYCILENSTKFCDILLSNDIDTEHLKLSILALIAGENPNADFGDNNLTLDDFDEDEEEDEDGGISSSHIEKYCVLVNDQVKLPTFPQISGREKEIDLMEEILCRKLKSNCILVGEAGTGKTTIVEGLAQMVEDPDYHGPLSKKKVYSLDLAALVAGTKYRGQFEARFSKLLSELKEIDDAILFIDEIHTIIGAGGKEGSQDFANMIKPALARGEIKCIGATTSTEYKKHFEKDAALSRRFYPIYVEEPSIEHVTSMVETALSSYELYHGVKFDIASAHLAIRLCDKYLPHQRFPDKVFDIIDQSSAKAKIRNNNQECSITPDDIYTVVADRVGVEIETIRELDNKKFNSFELNINSKIYGQAENISQIYDVLACAKAGLRSTDKPIASFFFVGPTSVGKTYTAKQIASEFYGNDKSFLQINMSEYQEKSSISRLIGTSAGYVGFEDGGLLTEFVRKNPNSLILFDEAEKCNPDVLNLLLQILDEGCLKDNLNRRIDFSRCVVVLTSNIGSSVETNCQLGFAPQKINKNDAYKNSVKKLLPPELISRIDELVIFNSLTEESIAKVFESGLNEVRNTLKKQKISASFSLDVKDFIDSKSEDHARDIKKIIRKSIEVPLAKFIMNNPENLDLTVKMLDGKLNIC